MNDCIQQPCRSPLACSGFGYCRARNDGKHTLFAYVRHADIPKYEAEGWVVVDDFSGCHHGHYAVLMGKAEE